MTEKKMCTRVVHELKELLGDEAANEVLGGFLRASDAELREIRRSLEAFLQPASIAR